MSIERPNFLNGCRYACVRLDRALCVQINVR
jgi:hypothetical protein